VNGPVRQPQPPQPSSPIRSEGGERPPASALLRDGKAAGGEREQWVLSLDLGGTKTAAALVSTQGRVWLRQQEATRQNGPRDGIEQVVRLLRERLEEGGIAHEGVLGIGVGIPAVLERQTDRVIWAPNLEGWRDVDLKFEVEQALGLPVTVEYDGHAAILGEWWQGVAKGYRSVAEVIIGTGIGGGLILDGRLISGMNRLAGAAGWFALTTDATCGEPPGRTLGHWESLAAGPGIVRRAQALIGQHPASTLVQPGRQMTARDVFDADAAGDPVARQVVDDTADLIGLGVANVVSLVNPEIVVLGGGIGAHGGERLLPRVREVVRRWAQPTAAESVVIKASTLGADGGLLGAAYAALCRSQGQSV